MKRLISLTPITLAILFGFGAWLTASPAGAAGHKTLYTCGMHPQIIQDHPGDCPICGMRLTPIHSTDDDDADTNGPAADRPAPAADIIKLEPATIQTMNLRTAIVVSAPLRRTMRTVGNVAYDETSIAEVTAKFTGWVEKLDVDATGALVNPGDALFEIDSPELYGAQTDFLAALSAAGKTPSAEEQRGVDSARMKLKFYDLSDEQIANLEKTRQPAKSLTVHAPISGFVTEKALVQGQMVEPGMKLYELADLAVVWVYAEIYPQDLPYVQLGQEATMTLDYLPDRTFRGRVTYVYPTVDEKTRTARVRLEFHNPGYFLKPGMFATVELVSEVAADAVQVPDSAVLRSGRQNTVFVALPGGRFEPRTVTLGMQASDDLDEVLSGLSAGELVVTSGQFMLDSESQLREAIQKMTRPGPEPGRTATVNPAMAEATNAPGQPAALATEPDKMVWVCPMPEHVSIEYDRPGKCPICGMTLVPVTPGDLKKLQPGGRVLYYTCPMPEHSYIHADKPGKCPKCGMTLIPVMGPPEEATNAAPATMPAPP